MSSRLRTPKSLPHRTIQSEGHLGFRRCQCTALGIEPMPLPIISGLVRQRNGLIMHRADLVICQRCFTNGHWEILKPARWAKKWPRSSLISIHCSACTEHLGVETGAYGLMLEAGIVACALCRRRGIYTRLGEEHT